MTVHSYNITFISASEVYSKWRYKNWSIIIIMMKLFLLMTLTMNLAIGYCLEYVYKHRCSGLGVEKYILASIVHPF